MQPRAKTIKILLKNGWEFSRHGANHDIYYNKTLHRSLSVKRHDFNDNDAKYILKEAGL